MTVSWTLKTEDVGLGIVPTEFKQKARELFVEAEKKRGGYVTMKITLPERGGTDAQNRAFHALLGEYWKSGLSSYESFEDMRDTIKLRIAGSDGYLFIDEKGRIKEVKSLDEVKGRYAEIPKSWSDFTIDQRKDAIDEVIREATMAGINSRKWGEIVSGMEDGALD
jgi:hypothetical protein